MTYQDHEDSMYVSLNIHGGTETVISKIKLSVVQ
jgi:hypothetical protein